MKLRDFFFVIFFEIKAVISQFFDQFFYSFTVFSSVTSRHDGST